MDKSEIELARLGVAAYGEEMTPLYDALRGRILGQLAVYGEDEVRHEHAVSEANQRLIGDFVLSLPIGKLTDKNGDAIPRLHVPDAATAHLAQSAFVWLAQLNVHDGGDWSDDTYSFSFDPAVIVGQKTSVKRNHTDALAVRSTGGVVSLTIPTQAVTQLDANLHAPAYSREQLLSMYDPLEDTWGVDHRHQRSVVVHTLTRMQRKQRKIFRERFADDGVNRQGFNNPDLHPIFRAQQTPAPELLTDRVLAEYDVIHHLTRLSGIFGKTTELAELLETSAAQPPRPELDK